MSTINPLFVDSTKPVGDKVVTQVEVLDVLLREDESLYFEVSDQFGFVQRYLMQAVETKKSIRYRVEVWLKYQMEIKWRFFIEAEEELRFTTEVKNARAGHIISEKWMPCMNALRKKKNPPAENKIPRRQPGSLGAKTRPLVAPHFFDQIKSLVSDLI